MDVASESSNLIMSPFQSKFLVLAQDADCGGTYGIIAMDYGKHVAWCYYDAKPVESETNSTYYKDFYCPRGTETTIHNSLDEKFFQSNISPEYLLKSEGYEDAVPLPPPDPQAQMYFNKKNIKYDPSKCMLLKEDGIFGGFNCSTLEISRKTCVFRVTYILLLLDRLFPMVHPELNPSVTYAHINSSLEKAKRLFYHFQEYKIVPFQCFLNSKNISIKEDVFGIDVPSLPRRVRFSG
uniref:Uncharacterized protein n=1 Tax=Syphacia muris TaxID=451379 RepID=A0A0N5AIN3_9BILA